MSDIDFQNGFINGFVSGSTNIEVDMVNRRDTEVNWQLINPIVANGEQIIVDTANGIKIKIGDGVNHFNDLEYVDKPITDILSQKVDKSEIPTALPAAGGNADTVGGKTATEIENTSKEYADKVKNDLLNGAGPAYDTLKDLGELIDENKDTLETLELVAIGKADKTHSHETSEINGLSARLDGIEGKIPTKNSQLTNDSEYVNTTELNTAIDNIQIGGRLTDSASGEVIAVTDSADGNFIDFKLYGKTTQKTGQPGKNILHNNVRIASFVEYSVAATMQADRSVLLTGTHTLSAYAALYYIGKIKCKAGKTYTLSGCPNLADCSLIVTDLDYNDITSISPDTGSGSTFTVSADVEYQVCFRVLKNVVFNNHILAPMVRLSDTDATYEQYALSPHPVSPAPLVSVGNSGSFEVGVYGKNLILPSIWGDSGTAYGVTYTRNADLSFTMSGTATSEGAVAMITIKYLPIGVPLTLSGGIGGWIYNSNGDYKGTWDNNKSIALGKGDFVRLFLAYVMKDTVVNKTVYPQIEISTQATDYEPYKAKQSITFTDTLRSVGDIKDEVDFARGVKIKRVHSVIIESTNDVSFSAYMNTIRISVSAPKALATGVGMCNSLTVTNYPIGANNADNHISGWVDGGVYFRCDALANATDKDAWLAEHPIHFVYPLATPIETPLTDAEMYAYRQLHTNNPNTTIITEGSPEMYVEYFRNTEESEALIKHSDRIPAIRKVYTPYGIYKPYYSAGDSIDIDTEVTGLIASSKQEVWFGIPLPKPIIGNPTITVSSINGLMVRQSGQYCFTTAGAVYVKPASYNQAKNRVNLYMGAYMSNTTNVTTGNAPCWVNVSVRVTLS